MKLNKFTKGLVAASALTLAGFANAGAYATATTEISNLAIVDVSGGPGTEVVFSNFDTNTFTNNFFGTIATADVTETDGFANPFVAEFGLTTPDFEKSAESVGYSSFAEGTVDFSGSGVGAGATGVTFAGAVADGNGSAQATSVISNNASLTVVGNDNQVAGEVFNVVLSFEYFFEVVAQTFNSWESGYADAFADISVSIFSASGETSIFSQEWSVNTFIGENENTNETPEGFTSGLIQLVEGESYTLRIDQESKVTASSVSEPTSLAILGLGLLGLAGAARRRKA